MSATLAAGTIWWREMVRFYRQKDRIVGALGTPFLFWLLLGSGLRDSFKPASGDMTYLVYFYPGSVVLMLLFTAIFSTISIIEDRREGFLQAVLVAPVPRASFVMGKMMGGSVIALFQGVLFLALAPLLNISLTPAAAGLSIVIMFLISFGLTGLGFMIAWHMDSTQGFHAIMNLFLMPMWFLSGAFFPQTGAPVVLEWVMRFNPMTYAVSALRQSLYLETSSSVAIWPSLPVAAAVVVLFCLLTFLGSLWMVHRRKF